MSLQWTLLPIKLVALYMHPQYISNVFKKKTKLIHWCKSQNHINVSHLVSIPEMYSGLFQTSKMKIFVKIVNGWKSLSIFPKSSILDVWLASEYSTSGNLRRGIKFNIFPHHIAILRKCCRLDFKRQRLADVFQGLKILKNFALFA